MLSILLAIRVGLKGMLTYLYTSASSHVKARRLHQHSLQSFSGFGALVSKKPFLQSLQREPITFSWKKEEHINRSYALVFINRDGNWNVLCENTISQCKEESTNLHIAPYQIIDSKRTKLQCFLNAYFIPGRNIFQYFYHIFVLSNQAHSSYISNIQDNHNVPEHKWNTFASRSFLNMDIDHQLRCRQLLLNRFLPDRSYKVDNRLPDRSRTFQVCICRICLQSPLVRMCNDLWRRHSLNSCMLQ